jgi:hypothetical protein
VSVRAVRAQVVANTLTTKPIYAEVFAPDCTITIAEGCIVRGPDGSVIGKVVEARLEDGGISAELSITDERAASALLGSLRWLKRPQAPGEDDA